MKSTAVSSIPSTSEKATHKRKTPAFPTSLSRIRRQTSTTAAMEIPILEVPPIILKPHIQRNPESLPPSPSGTKMQNVQDFVTSFISKEATVKQEPVANLSKVDTQDKVLHVANAQEPTTDSIGVTQEPLVENLEIDNLSS